MSKNLHTSNLDVDGTFYETVLNKTGDNSFELRQANPINQPFYKYEETVILDRDQAIHIAKTILRNEGIHALD